ncbi:BadF/BadG/BcrA/BcrD ATPase family protein [Falsirhodobacter xinxiangensis]|uniref:BadF/BadG/BcrA/BcrD ATPase family protein n=1 Tax=Falsirhodobacter xinxiangensis TaxID=2530049 RepID=UPI0010AA6542|nr:BadF/BadG/BcrA/BcrD ATPase family protein [Rhodobacter xinxiangensis]
MALYLGIDGGGSGCRAILSDGVRILGCGTGGPANIASDPAGAVSAILHAMVEAGVTGAPATVMGLAGANVPGAADRLLAALPFPCRIVSDAITAARGALGAADGVVAAIGTGSVFAVQRNGVLRQSGGWGFGLGDEAGGAWLGRRLLQRALAASEGWADTTPLLREVTAAHDGPGGIVRFGVTARAPDYAALAPRIVGSNDHAALAILAEAEAEIAAAIDHLRQGEDMPVVFLGGLGPHFAARMAGRWDVRAPLGSSLDGALALAQEAA